MDCCCIVANCTPEIVKFAPGPGGEVVIRAGCEVLGYTPDVAMAFFTIVMLLAGIVIGRYLIPVKS